MQHDFWLGRWKRGETGWHQSEVEPELVGFFSSLPPTRVFVPLCGKSLDLVWLASRGHQVIGVELSPLACAAFFTEHNLPFKSSSQGSFERLESESITLLNGDIFQLTPEILGPIGAVYDRAALIALPPPLREQYAAQISQLVTQCRIDENLKFLQLVLQRTPQDTAGPPFSVPTDELQRLYGAHFSIRLIKREGVSEMPGTEECSFELTYSVNLR